MAIQINSQTVIDNNKNIINISNGNFAGIVTATKFVGQTGSVISGNVGLLLTFGY